MSVTDARGRLAFLGFTEADARLLQTLKPWAETIINDFSKEFYDRSYENPGFRAVVERYGTTRSTLEAAQAGYALSYFSGYPDETYIRYRELIGRRHTQIGVEPQYYISSYGFYNDHLMPRVRKHLWRKRGKVARAIEALQKLMLFDQAIIMDAYIGGLIDEQRTLIDKVVVTAEGVGKTSAAQQRCGAGRRSHPGHRKRQPGAGQGRR